MKRNFAISVLGGLVGSVLVLIVLSATGIVGADGPGPVLTVARMKPSQLIECSCPSSGDEGGASEYRQ